MQRLFAFISTVVFFIVTGTPALAVNDLLVCGWPRLPSLEPGHIYRFNGNTGAFGGAFTDGFAESIEALTYAPNGDLYAVRDLIGVDTILKFNGTTGAYLGTISPGFTRASPDMFVRGDNQLYLLQSFASFKGVLRHSLAPGAPFVPFTQADAGGLQDVSSFVFAPDGDLLMAGRFSFSESFST